MAKARYQQIADELRSAIETGEYGPGALLPSLVRLAERYGVAKGTAVQALGVLEREGLVEAIEGKGFIVRPRPIRQQYTMDRYARRNWPGTRRHLTLDVATVPAPEVVSRRLGIAPGADVRVQGWMILVNERPHELAFSYLKSSLAERMPLTEPIQGPLDTLAHIEGLGVRIGEVQEELTARTPDRRETEALRLPAAAPVMSLVRTAFDVSGRPVEVMIATLVGDASTFVYRFPVSE
ncbi:GntR family transcriptional regulator [Microbispora sp. NBRC 16548]|uniref:GntR family transcriptional regulator n=1 Tax=Microbispora sp. NBRC 16548 TaxID=3030994 RepID=UPI00161E9A97|nr:GntR family transcriptional regulator [Microbispora sp. NBRC 16548]GLX06685.1 GntR family transcriptional regulator [Microbispora sp. NBRC 16548]